MYTGSNKRTCTHSVDCVEEDCGWRSGDVIKNWRIVDGITRQHGTDLPHIEHLELLFEHTLVSEVLAELMLGVDLVRVPETAKAQVVLIARKAMILRSDKILPKK
jgi:hypothetical protein